MNARLTTIARRRGGYAMAMFLIILMLLTAISTTVITTTYADAEASRQVSARAEARSLATSGIEELYARVTYQPGFLSPLLTTPAGTVDHPGVGNGKWAAFTGSTPTTCPGFDVPCYQITLTPKVVGSGATTKVVAVVVDVVTRTRCQGREDGCTVTRFRQVLRKQQFFDYLFFNTVNALDPSLYPASTGLTVDDARTLCGGVASTRTDTRCVEIAYQGDAYGLDVIRGPVYSGDDRILVCGNPRFEQSVSIRGSGYAGRVWARASDLRGDTCNGTPAFLTGDTGVNATPLEMPSVFTTAQQAAVVADPRFVLTGADISIVLKTVGTGASARTTVSISGSNADGTDLPLPTAGIIVVDGSARVSGTLAGRLSIFASGKITVPADLKYHSGATEANVSDLLGLTAGTSIILTHPDRVSPTGREVHALLLALNGTVYTEGWDSAAGTWSATNPAPTLKFFGAIAGRYQGVYGGYDSATGALINGFRKDFTFDARASRGVIEPVFLVSPDAEAWLRLDQSEVSVCAAATQQLKTDPFLARICNV